jgi:NodT family efflux transporter outer membrane factor (OMF) lipoprotein
MNARNPKIWLLLAFGAMLGGCKVGPNYHRPDVPVAPQYKELPGWTAATPEDKAPKGDWWTDFNDDLLNQLEPMVAVSNLTVRQDYANYQQALAEVRVADAQLFPTIGVSGAVTRARNSSTVSSTSLGTGTNTGTGTSTTVTGTGTTGTGTGTGTTGTNTVTTGKTYSIINSGSLEATASWTPDIWGAVRRLIEQNKATAQADEATLANATLSEQVLLATTLIELRMADAGIDLQQKTVDAYQKSFEVTKQQGSAGITATPPSAVITARVAWETAQANLIGLGVARAQYAHAIAVLVGKNPEDLDIPHSNTVPSLPTVPVGVPSTLLQRRPDISTAERTMAAQNAAIGIAVAAYYPTIPLTGSIGFSQAPLAGLLHTANEVWSVGASATETVIDFGERHAEVTAAKAVYAAAVANYRLTVLNAFADVENDLSGLHILGEQAKSLDVAVNDSIRGTDIALAEFEAGTVDYTTVALAQENQLADQQTQLTVQQSRLLAAVSLIGDLGGGWSADQLHNP